MVDGPVRPLPKQVVLSRGPAGVPARGHGPGAGPAVEDMGFPLRLPPPHPLAAGPGRTPACCSACRGPDGPLPLRRRGAPSTPDLGAALMAAHRHADTLPLGNQPRKSDRKRGVLRFAPTSGARHRPSSLGPPPSRAFSSPGRVNQRQPLPPPKRHSALQAAHRTQGPAQGCNRHSVLRIRVLSPRPGRRRPCNVRLDHPTTA